MTGVLGSLRAAAAQLVRVASASGDVLPTLLMAAKDDLGMAPVGPAACVDWEGRRLSSCACFAGSAMQKPNVPWPVSLWPPKA